MSAHPDRKPNLIFDVTLKSVSKLEKIAMMASELGYKKENIHIVWVLNDLDTALVQNAERDRRVSDDILKNTHIHVNYQMKDFMTGGTNMRRYMDGHFFIAFNKKYADSLVKVSMETSKDTVIPGKGGSGMYIKDAFYVEVKPKLGVVKSLDKLSDDVVKRLKERVPDKSIWS